MRIHRLQNLLFVQTPTAKSDTSDKVIAHGQNICEVLTEQGPELTPKNAVVISGNLEVPCRLGQAISERMELPFMSWRELSTFKQESVRPIDEALFVIDKYSLEVENLIVVTEPRIAMFALAMFAHRGMYKATGQEPYRWRDYQVAHIDCVAQVRKFLGAEATAAAAITATA